VRGHTWKRASSSSRTGSRGRLPEEATAAESSRARDTKKVESLAREVKALKKEREEVRARLERLVELLESLD
jgi:ubiquinone biosynthesis protein UbiJ